MPFSDENLDTKRYTTCIQHVGLRLGTQASNDILSLRIYDTNFLGMLIHFVVVCETKRKK